MVGVFDLFLAAKAKEHFVLIEAAGICVNLIDHEYLGAFQMRADIGVDLVIIRTNSTPHITVMMRHLYFPGLSICTDARAMLPARGLNGNLHPVNLWMALGIIASGLLRVAGRRMNALCFAIQRRLGYCHCTFSPRSL